MARLRLAHVIDSLRPDGTQASLVHLVRGLAARDYEQRVYSLNDVVDAGIAQRLGSPGVHLKVIGKARLVVLVGLASLLIDFVKWRPHVVQTYLPYADVVGRTLARAALVPVIICSIRARNLQKHWWHFLLDRLTIRWADKVVFNSRNVITFAREHEGVRADQIVYIPNGVDLARLQPSSKVRRRIHSELRVAPSCKVIGTVGRLVPQKGHRFLLEAFAQSLTDVPDAVLLIIGDGPLRGRLEAEAVRRGIADRVRFLGQRCDVPVLLSRMDLYVHASLYEGMPNAVMEAMAAAKPVVATRVDGTLELITDGATGWLVEAKDTGAMSHRITYALKHPTEALGIGQAAARRMATEFSIDQMVSSYDSLYRGLVATKLNGLVCDALSRESSRSSR